MKTRKLISIIILLALTLSGCREIEVKTIINTDGSFTRVITVKGDSAKVIRLYLPYPVDSSWTSEVVQDTADSTRYICTHTKHFQYDEDLQDEIDQDTSWWKYVDRKIEITRSFRFFYSFVRYRETYKAANPSTVLDYRDYLSKQDLRWIAGEIPLNEKDSSAKEEIEGKIEKYLADVLVEELLLSFENGIRNLDDSLLQAIDVRMYKDSVHTYFFESLYSTDGQPQLMKSIDMLALWTGKDEILQLHNADPSIFEDFNNKFIIYDNLIGMNAYNVVIEMPGLLTETNSYKLVGNQVKWRLNDQTFFFEDFEMYAESRVVNYWAFIVSGIVLLLLLIMLVVKLFK